MHRFDPDTSRSEGDTRPTPRAPAPRAIALQRMIGNRATAKLLQRDPPTFGNLPRDAPALGSSRDIVRLRNVNGTWRAVGPKYSNTARGTYAFVVKDGEIFAVKPKRSMGGQVGHTEAARGERVEWAGLAEFEAGELKSWSNASGHYRPAESFREVAERAGLPPDRFDAHVRAPGEIGPQLPVQQPATKPRVPGEPPKVGPGPPRLDELEKAIAQEAATESVVKVEGRAATAIGKVGSAAGWVADFLLPGPQDAILLMVQFAMSYKEAQEAAEAGGMRYGFGEGLVASLLGLKRKWVRNNLAPRTISKSVASEVAATTGYREKGVAEGLVAGLSFGERLSREQRDALLHTATRAMRANGDPVNLRAWWEAGYTEQNVDDLALALAPQVDQILEEARENARIRERAKEIQRLKDWGPLAPIADILEPDNGTDAKSR